MAGTTEVSRLTVAVGLALAALITGCSTGDETTTPSGSLTASTGPDAAAPVPAGSAAPVAGPYAPVIDPAAFTSIVDNPFLPLRPGMRWEYRTESENGIEVTVVEVTTSTRVIMGVRCVEVRDTVRLDGDVIEDTLDWYAQHHDGTVWYFGEDTREYEGGQVVSTEGSWMGGVDGALPGIVMPGRPRIGDRYRQEYYVGHAEDMAEVLSMAEQATVPTGSYDAVIETSETTPLEPQLLEHKYYARGVGAALMVDVAGGGTRDELVSFTG